MQTCHRANIQAAMWRQSLRQHCDIASISHREPHQTHWVLNAVCARYLLILRLRQTRPDLRFTVWLRGDAIDTLLDAMLDELGWRGHQRPRGCIGHLRHLHWIVDQWYRIQVSIPTPPSSFTSGECG